MFCVRRQTDADVDYDDDDDVDDMLKSAEIPLAF